MHISASFHFLDFAENYSFLVQDAIQGYHWVNDQATLHPFSVYTTKGHVSYCVISDHMAHSSIAVHAFRTAVLEDLKAKHPEINEIIYFSDGAGSQYKNFKNLTNLLHHESDYGIKASWNFFATSHGKNTCDGIGGTVKRLARRHSLQQVSSGHILTPAQLYEWTVENISGIKALFVSSSQVEAIAEGQKERFDQSSKLNGVRECHRILVEGGALYGYRLSGDSDHVTQNAPSAVNVSGIELEHPETLCAQYVALMYFGQWYLGSIQQFSPENDDYRVKCMHPAGSPTSSFYWPSPRDDIVWVPRGNVICVVKSLVPNPSGRQYNISAHERQTILKLLPG